GRKHRASDGECDLQRPAQSFLSLRRKKNKSCGPRVYGGPGSPYFQHLRTEHSLSQGTDFAGGQSLYSQTLLKENSRPARHQSGLNCVRFNVQCLSLSNEFKFNVSTP